MSDRSSTPTSLARALVLASIGTVVVLGSTLVVVLASGRAFQVDEVEHVHAAYEVRAGRLIYAQFHQPHNPLLYYTLWPVIDPGEPVASFQRARWMTTAFFVLNVALVGLCAGRLGGPPAGVLAAGLALCHTTFVERGMEVRTDGPMSLMVTAALAVELSGLVRSKRYCWEALLLSLAFLFTNKASFACFAFGCLWLAAAIRERRLRLVAAPMAIWLAPLAAAAGAMAAAGNLTEYVRLNLGQAAGELLRTAPRAQELTLSYGARFLPKELARNVAFCALALGGWALAAASWLRRSARARTASGLRFTAFLAALLFLSLWLNPFPFPYLHVTVLPAFLVLAGVAGSRIVERLGLAPLGAAAWAVILVLLTGAAAQGMPYLARRGVSFLDPQLATLREIQRVVEPGDAVFDMAGLYFRPDGYFFYVMTVHHVSLYRLGEAGGMPRIPDELRRREAVAYGMNYRFHYLPEEDQLFVHDHFVHYDGNVFLQGSRLRLEPGETIDFEVLKAKEFRYDGEGAILVDGAPFRRGFLARGPHRITRVERRGPDRLIMATPPPVPWPPRPPQQLYDFF